MSRLSNKIKLVLGAALMTVGLLSVWALPVGAIVCPDSGREVDKASECAKDGVTAVDPDTETRDLPKTIRNIINAVIFIIGIVAVVMIILGGIQYSTSQGDPGKVKKAKDTIMYGIIGLIVAILAFAIVNFVLENVFR